jgi:hypothetical protein
MPDHTFAENLNTNPYFLSLPTYVQETIKQAGPKVQSDEDLRKIADNLTKKK